MSLWARVALAIAATVTGMLLVPAALARTGAWPIWGVAAFCFLIAACCVTRGRPNTLCWSLIGAGLFAGTAAYAITMAMQGRYVGNSFSEPSLVWALFLLATFGWWGAVVAWRMGRSLWRG